MLRSRKHDKQDTAAGFEMDFLMIKMFRIAEFYCYTLEVQSLSRLPTAVLANVLLVKCISLVPELPAKLEVHCLTLLLFAFVCCPPWSVHEELFQVRKEESVSCGNRQ